MHVIVSFQAKFQSVYLCVAAVEGLLEKKHCASGFMDRGLLGLSGLADTVSLSLSSRLPGNAQIPLSILKHIK